MQESPKFSNTAWAALLDRAVARIKSLAESKGGEYSGDEDRLENFRRQGLRLGLPMEVVWSVYANKHWDSLATYIKDLNTGRKRNYSEPIDGRVDDLLVYLLLFKAMLEERAGPKDVMVILQESNAPVLHGIVYCQFCSHRLFPAIPHDCQALLGKTS